jgi:nitrite reductase (NAD(P)H)
LATGSDAALPPYVTRERFWKTTGAFVYRNIADLDQMLAYSKEHKIKRAAVVGGGLLGLEAGKALLDLDTVEQAIIVERNQWVLSRQLDGEGGRMVLDKVKALGVEVLLQARVRDLITKKEGDEDKERLKGILLEGGSEPDKPYDLDMIVFAVGIKPRDELGGPSGITTAPRGGFAIDSHLKTNVDDIYAIGECASFKGETWGLIAPGVEMADILAFNLTEGPHHSMREMTSPDLSTKLKLMGVDVASFGDFFADKGKLTRPLPGSKRRGGKEESKGEPQVKAMTYRDPFSDVYKKYIFTADGKYLVGGMMVGDVKDYVKLVGLCSKQKPIEKPPNEFILGAKKEGEEEGDDLDNDAQICSCHNVTKGQVFEQVKGGCHSFGDLKSCTKLGTGCGGCVPLGTSIFNQAMKNSGQEVSNNVCPHFQHSRPDLFMIVKFRKLKDFAAVMKSAGVKEKSLGCEVCRPAVGSILSSLYNDWIMAPALRQTQDTNDRFLANIQRDGTYSVVPRMPAGEVSPYKLKVLGEVAEDFKLYSKITGGQRIDLFGAKKQDLPAIWTRLIDAGFESGHAYGKSLRTVKSCVGTTWCRYGVGDSVAFAVELENRYRSIRSPHKFKSAVSGCNRDCAEFHSKDFGVLATPKGWNVVVGGNGGAKPRHAFPLAENVTKHMAVKLIDRFLALYIRSADKLQRTARWIESLPGGINELKSIIIDDKLGICEELEKDMQDLIGTFHCEWTKVVQDPERQKVFRQFVNTDERTRDIEPVKDRGQFHPEFWPEESAPLKFSVLDVAKSAKWEWRPVCNETDVEPVDHATTSAVVKYGDVQIAIYHVPNKGWYSSQQMCPHRRANVLADGLIGEDDKGNPYVACPLHKRQYLLDPDLKKEGGFCKSDDSYQIMTFEAKVEDGKVLLKLPDTDSLDAILSTSKWMIRKATEESHLLAGGKPGEEVYPERGDPQGGIEIAGIKDSVTMEGKDDSSLPGQGEKKQQQKASCGDSTEGGKLDW